MISQIDFSLLVPIVAALISLSGALFSESNRRKRIMCDIKIYKSLQGPTGLSEFPQMEKKNFMEHIVNEMHWLVGPSASWIDAIKAAAAIIVSSALFLSLGMVGPLIEVQTSATKLIIVFLMFSAVLAGAIVFTIYAIRCISRYLSLRSYISAEIDYTNDIPNYADSAEKQITAETSFCLELCNEIEKLANKSNTYIRSFRRGNGKPYDVIILDPADTISALRQAEDEVNSVGEMLDEIISSSITLEDRIDRSIEAQMYINSRVLFHKRLQVDVTELDSYKTRIQKVHLSAKRISGKLRESKEIIAKALHVFLDAEDKGVFDEQVVIRDQSRGLTLVSDKRSSKVYELGTFFRTLTSDCVELIRANKDDPTIMIVTKEESGVFTVVGFLLANNEKELISSLGHEIPVRETHHFPHDPSNIGFASPSHKE